MRLNDQELKDVAESVAKEIAAQQKSPQSLAKVVHDNTRALNQLLAKQGDVCAVAKSTCYTQINISREVDIQLHKITEQASWLKKVTSSKGSFFDLNLSLIGLGLGDHGCKVYTHLE